MNAPRIVVIQPVVPDYRVPLFDALYERFGSDFAVYASSSAGDGTIRMDARANAYVHSLKTKHWLRGQFVWQAGMAANLERVPVVIAPGSLRILSAQWLLLRRRLAGRPTILWGHAHGSNRWAGLFRRGMVRAADGFIAYSRSDGEVIRRIRGDSKVWVAANSCVWQRECRPAFKRGATPLNVLAVGRLVREKKPVLLLDAFARATREQLIPGRASLVFTGDGPLRQALLERAAALGISDRVVLTGHISDRERLESLYADAAVAVAAGSLGLSGIQSFSAGVPMVVSRTERHGPELEAAREGFNTIFFPTDSEAGLVDGLAEVFRDAESWSHRRAMIAAEIAANYTYEGMVAAFIDAIESSRREDDWG
jgi:glycosyltransferase involved in cell wall biosynthesis